MPTYKAPVRDMRFLMNEVFDFESRYKMYSMNFPASLR